MDNILQKLKYSDQERIALLNAPEEFTQRVSGLLPGVQIDTVINARYLYDFIIAFTSGSEVVKSLGPACIHNLRREAMDGISEGDIQEVHYGHKP